MNNSQNSIGYRDQEVLIGAIVAYSSKKIDKSLPIIKGMIRMSIEECSKKSGKTLKETKELSEEERDLYFADIIKIFFEKMNLDLTMRRKIKFDVLQIYERWKQLKRLDIDTADPNRKSDTSSENIVKNEIIPEELSENIIDPQEDDLISELETLDLDGL